MPEAWQLISAAWYVSHCCLWLRDEKRWGYGDIVSGTLHEYIGLHDLLLATTLWETESAALAGGGEGHCDPDHRQTPPGS